MQSEPLRGLMAKLTVQPATDKGFRPITADLLELEAQQQSWPGLEPKIAVLDVEVVSSRRRGSCPQKESTTEPAFVAQKLSAVAAWMPHPTVTPLKASFSVRLVTQGFMVPRALATQTLWCLTVRLRRG